MQSYHTLHGECVRLRYSCPCFIPCEPNETQHLQSPKFHSCSCYLFHYFTIFISDSFGWMHIALFLCYFDMPFRKRMSALDNMLEQWNVQTMFKNLSVCLCAHSSVLYSLNINWIYVMFTVGYRIFDIVYMFVVVRVLVWGVVMLLLV